MKFKKIVESLDGIEEKYHELYEKKADGKFHLLVEDDAADELKRAKEHEKVLRQQAENKLRENEAELETLRKLREDIDKSKEKQAREDGDIKALEKSWSDKHAKTVGEKDTEITRLKKIIQTNYVDNVALKIAADLAGDAAEIILPHIAKRLSVEFDGEQAVTRVIDGEGKPSALTVEELQNEFFTNPKFKAIVIASKASGGGAQGAQGGGAVKKKFAEMTALERTEYFDKHGAEAFKKLQAAG